jgi:hypothetical protein
MIRAPDRMADALLNAFRFGFDIREKVANTNPE